MQDCFMSDTRNAFLAWSSSLASFLTAVETRDLITVISAIVLPVVFFTIGKTVDVCVQIYLKKRVPADKETERRD